MRSLAGKQLEIDSLNAQMKGMGKTKNWLTCYFINPINIHSKYDQVDENMNPSSVSLSCLSLPFSNLVLFKMLRVNRAAMAEPNKNRQCMPMNK